MCIGTRAKATSWLSISSHTKKAIAPLRWHRVKRTVATHLRGGWTMSLQVERRRQDPPLPQQSMIAASGAATGWAAYIFATSANYQMQNASKPRQQSPCLYDRLAKTTGTLPACGICAPHQAPHFDSRKRKVTFVLKPSCSTCSLDSSVASRMSPSAAQTTNDASDGYAEYTVLHSGQAVEM